MFKPLMLGTLLTGFTLVSASLVMADGNTTLKVTDAWTTPALTKNGSLAVYMHVENTNEMPVSIIGAETGEAEHSMIHQTSTDKDGTSHMEHLMQLDIPANSSVDFKPGSTHVMLMGLKKQFKKGDSFPLTLEVEKGEPVQVQVEVRALEAKNQ